MKGFWIQLGRAIGISSPSPRWFIAFVLGSVAIGLVGSGLFDLVIEWRGRSVGTLLWLTVGPFVVLLGVGLIFATFATRQRSATNPDQDDDDFAPYPILILFLSPGENKSHIHAIDRHVRHAVLRECHLIYTTDQSRENGEAVRTEYLERIETINLLPLHDATNVRAAFETVRGVIDHAGVDGATREEIIVDITGGTKMMTAGAVLACADRGVAIQYIEGGYDPRGTLTNQRPAIRRVLLSPDIGSDGHLATGLD